MLLLEEGAETTSSGAPVFQRGVWTGIVSSAPAPSGRRVVVPMSELRRDLRWCLAAGVPADAAALRRLVHAKEEIRKKLTGLPELAALLKERLDVSGNTLDELVVAVMSSPAEVVLMHVYTAWARSDRDPKLAGRLAALSRDLVPWCFYGQDPELRASTDHELHLSISATHRSIAEVVVAGAEARATYFHKGPRPSPKDIHRSLEGRRSSFSRSRRPAAVFSLWNDQAEDQLEPTLRQLFAGGDV